MNGELTLRLGKAERLLGQAEARMAPLVEHDRVATPDAVSKALGPVLEAIEEAQQLLFDEQDEVEDSPVDPEAELFPEGDETGPASVSGQSARDEEGSAKGPVGEDHFGGDLGASDQREEEEEVDGATQAFLDRKLRLEQRSRELEARCYEMAARRLAPGLSGLGAASEEQDKFLASAVSALEALFLAEPSAGTLVRIAELQVSRREVKKAKAYLGKALELEPENAAAVDLLERIRSDPAIKDKSKCFIATAAMGSAEVAEVQTLRSFRDRVLLKHAVGRVVVAAYYEVSPPLARILEENARLRELTARFLIRPLAKAAGKIPGVA